MADSCQQQASQKVQGAFYRAFYSWGHLVGRRPCTVIWVTLLVAIAASAQLILSFAGNALPSETEQDKLWVPQDAQAVDDKGRYDAIFNNTFRRNTMYFTTKPPGGNVLTSPILAEIRRFDLLVTQQLNATAFESGADGEALVDERGNAAVTYNDVCARSSIVLGRNLSDPDDEGGIPCVLFGHPFEAFYRIGGGVPRAPLWLPGDFNFDFTDAEINAILTAGRGPDKTLFPDSSNRTVNVQASYGGIERDPTTNAIVSAKSVSLTYLLAEHLDGTDERNAAIAWEDQLNSLVGAEWTEDCLSEGSASGTCSDGETLDDNGAIKWSSTLISVFPSTAGATSRELGKNIRADLTALQAGFMIILVYAVLIFARCQPVQSRVLLALSGILSVGLSVAVAYGFSTLVGLKLNPVVNVLPFILIGIGVDDMFVLKAALEAEPVSDPSSVPERIARAMGKAGVSITITSLTDVFAFFLGTFSSLPALSDFCGFAAVGITADFLLQISFFAGFMALDAYREAKSKQDCCPCCCVESISSRVAQGEAKSGCCCFKPCYDKFDYLPPYGLKPFLKKYYIPMLHTKGVKAVVVVAFVAWAAASTWMATQLKQDFKFRWFVNDDAQLQQTFDIEDAYFASTGLPVSIVTPSSDDFDYTSIAGQKALVALAAAVNANSFVEQDSVSMWYLGFREWIHECGLTIADASPSCVTRDCTFGGGGALTYPHCTKAKNLRDAGGNELLDGNGRELPGASDLKWLVLEDGTTSAPDSGAIGSSFIPPAKFEEWLDQYLADAPLGAMMSSEVIYQSSQAVRDCSVPPGCALRATRVRANYKATDTADEQVESMKSLRTSVASANVGDSYPYMFMYLYYEQYAIIQREAILNLGLALVAVCIICLVVLANVGATCLVMLCVLLVDIDILGLMWLWGLTIDSVAIINLVLAVGLAVDYSAHVAHAFCQAQGTRQERADHAVLEMGSAVIHGATSTFLAVLILSTSKSYIFRIFFKQFFGICVFGAAHGLLFLPVILSICGPAPLQLGVQFHDGPSPKPKGKDSEMTVSAVAMAMEPAPTPPSSLALGVSPPPSAPSSECGSPSSRTGSLSRIQPAQMKAADAQGAWPHKPRIV